MNKNIYQSFEPVSYNTLDVDINSITINNPYIDIVDQKIGMFGRKTCSR